MNGAPQEALAAHHVLLVDWWRTNRRDFPWRRDDVTPYQMLVAEMLLWRTRAESVDTIWDDFFKAFPTMTELAEATEDEIDSIIAPLGLRKRAGYLKLMAQRILHDYDGEVPQTKAELTEILGVGEYVSSAVLAFMFGKDEAVYDANVRRILFRVLDTEDDKEAREHAVSLLPKGYAAEWNYALLDLGAMICRWRPECARCPLLSICETGRAKTA